jgi:predicted Zn-ribbon and HTH transcriptional regulator
VISALRGQRVNQLHQCASMELDYRGAAIGLASEVTRDHTISARKAHYFGEPPTRQFWGGPLCKQKLVRWLSMQCPRCKSLRIQLGYKDRSILSLLAGVEQFLCNNCGLEFKSFDISGKVQRAPVTKAEALPNRRRAPRYKAHLPAVISLAEKDAASGKLKFSKASRGHCVTISKLGLALSFIGSRFGEEEFVRTGRLLFVTVTLPKGAIDAVVTIVRHERVVAEEATGRWFVQASITHMSEGDTARLLSYLKKRENEAPIFTQE